MRPCNMVALLCSLFKMPKVDVSKCRVLLCDYKPTSRQDLDAHVQAEHVVGSQYVCTVCKKTASQMSNLNSHIKATHTFRERFECPYEGCGRSQANERHLNDHIQRDHLQTGPTLSCDEKGCKFTTVYANVLASHKVTHSDERLYACEVDGCGYSAKRLDTLRTHQLSHTNECHYPCTVCSKRFRHRSGLSHHMQKHTPTKPWLSCETCTFRTQRASKLREHVNETHLQIKPCVCTTCGYASARPSKLREHINAVHKEGEALTCPFGDCDYQTYWPDRFSYHKRFGHTEAGVRVRNGEEYQALRALSEFFPVQTSYVIQQHHLVGLGRKFINIDGVIRVPETNLIVFVEIDEQQHKDATLYSIPEELSRMEDATAGMRYAGSHAHILWIRFNPNTYTVNGVRTNESISHRVDAIKEFIDEFSPSADEMTIVYAFYDVEDDEATIIHNDEFFEELRDCVQTIF